MASAPRRAARGRRPEASGTGRIHRGAGGHRSASAGPRRDAGDQGAGGIDSIPLAQPVTPTRPQGETMNASAVPRPGSGRPSRARGAVEAAATILFVLGSRGPASAAVLNRGPYLQVGSSSRITIRWRTDVAT